MVCCLNKYFYYSFIIFSPLDAYFNWLDSAIYRKLATCFTGGTGSNKFQTVTSQSFVCGTLNKCFVAPLSNRYNMDLIYLVLAAVDLAGVVFNMRMLQSCFKDKTKNTFVQRSRMLAIWQVTCQATILVMDAVESLNRFDVHPSESCNVFRVMSIIMMLIQVCNITAIMIIYLDHYMADQNKKQSSKVKITGAVSMGIIGSIMIWWYSCGFQEIISQIAVRVVCVVCVAFVLFLLCAALRNNIDGVSEGVTTEASMETSPLLLRGLKDDKKLISFIALLLMVFVLILSDVPHLSLHFKEACFLLVTRFVVGFVLPLTVIDVIDSSHG